MRVDIDAKLQALAQIIEGRVIKDAQLPVFVKGSMLGFPAILKAFNTRWPFGVSYFLETEVVVDPNKTVNKPSLTITICPRHARGIWKLFSQILLFEGTGMPIDYKQLESQFIFSYNNRQMAERFIKYPGVADALEKLERYSKFGEMKIKSDAGIFLSQPVSFEALNLDVCKETFKLLGDLGQIIFETF